MASAPPLPRRSFLSASAAAWAMRGARAAPPSPTKVRYDIATEAGQKMLAIYAEAVQAMKARPASDPTSWTFQWYIHFVGGKTKEAAIHDIFGAGASPAKKLAEDTWNTCQAHLGGAENQPSFLPWHRMYVYQLEQIVRKVAGVPEFTLPYWNYSDPAEQQLPSAFRNVSSPLYAADRTASVNNGAAIPPDLVKLTALRETSYNSDGVAPGVNTGIDRGIHGNVHTWVGNRMGMGSVAWAANDPVFWVHHCNIDRLWASWNHSGGANPTDAAWLDRQFVFADENGLRVAMRNGQVSQTAQLGYTYDRFAPASAVPTLPRGAAALLAATPADHVASLTGSPADIPLAVSRPLAGAGRLYLVIDDVRANSDPGVVFRVYINLPRQARAAEAAMHEVGVLNFFEATHHMPGMARNMAGIRVSFPVEHPARAQGGTLVVTIIPDGTPLPKSNPRVGRISLMRAP